MSDDGYLTLFERGRHKYLVLYNAATRAEALRTLLRWAEDERFNLTTADVLRISCDMPGAPPPTVVRIAE